MAKKESYQAAYANLQKIYEDLRSGQVEIDDLDVKLKKALEYISICKEVLKKQEAKVTDVLKEKNYENI